MKIVKIIHGYPPLYNAGSEVYSQSICEELSKTNQVYVFTREENPYLPDFTIRKEKINENLEVFFTNMAQGKDGFKHKELDSIFSNLLNEINPDVAHVGHLNHLSIGFIDVLKSKNIPIAFTLHDFWLMCPRGQFLQRNFGNTNHLQLCDKQENTKCATNCYNAYFTGQEDNKDSDISFWSTWIGNRMKETKEITNKVDIFIAPSNYLKARFVKEFGVSETKIQYLDYGFPLHYLTPTEKKEDTQSFTFGYIGTHIPAKGVNLLIEAFLKLKGKAVLKIWGWKDQNNTKTLIDKARVLGLPIEFKGEYVNKNLADEVFSQVDCIVVPSIWGENSPLVIHEAQACHIPVITANYGGMAEYVEHQVNGLLFEHRDSISLAEQMQWAIENKSVMSDFGKKGYLFSNDGSVPEIKEHCNELVKIYQSLQKKKTTDSLWRITIDTNPEDCNLSCTMCEEHSQFSKYIDTLFKETGVKRRRMPVEWLDKIFAQAKEMGVKEIIPSTMGEPLLYKGFERIYDLAKEHQIKINLTTNGTFPKKSVKEWAKIIVPQTSDVKISWNGSTAETSEKVMVGIDFENAIENVKQFVEYRNLHFINGGNYCRVTFQLTFMQNNMHELAEIIKLAAHLDVDRVKGHHLWAHFDEIKNLSMKVDSLTIKKWNVFVEEAYASAEQYRRPNGEKVLLENIYPLENIEEKNVPENYGCPFLKKEIWISATGKISPCCAPDKERDKLGDFGNIQDQTLQEIVSGNNYQNLVANYKNQNLCKTCNMRKP
ncbi:MAG: glycosyltransferase [bacterium]|nr:glycosyltransferase [bacterium]